MAFILRRPYAITATIRQISNVAKPVTRQFHQDAFQRSTFASKSAKTSRISQSRDVFRATFKRHYTPQSVPGIANQGSMRQRLLYGGAVLGGTIFAINMVFNRETREDGGMPLFERSYLNDTFMHTGLGLGIIAVAARTLHMNGWSYRLMAMNPWLVVGVSLAGSIGSMIATRSTSPDK